MNVNCGLHFARRTAGLQSRRTALLRRYAPVALAGQMALLGVGAALAEPVAVVNNVAIQREQVSTLIASSRADDTQRLRDQIRDALVDHELLRQAAAASITSSDPQVQRDISSTAGSIEIQAYLKRFAPPAPVSAAAIRERYASLVKRMGPTDYLIRLMVLPDATQAHEMIAQIEMGADFGVLAQHHGLGPTALAGGNLPWLNLRAPVAPDNTRGLPVAVANAVTGMPVGERSLIGADGRFYIVELVARRAAHESSFDDSEGMIREELQREARKTATMVEVSRLRKLADIRE